MHEYAIVRALMDRVDQEAEVRKALRVHRVRIRLGEAAGVDGELLATAFRTYREAAGCGATDLEVVPVRARWACTGCGREVPQGEVLQCRACGLPARLIEGDEILLDRIEMEVA
ncbi:MAG TPA: hydrogenase maturation nickel metallochaperone HypA [Candidatus Polarisedimenticolaceae bacterium]|nr:hydrogenase maturation nickel metallochaperone HypA [Candidatus Polarisedimenticolaceae bacterium]